MRIIQQTSLFFMLVLSTSLRVAFGSQPVTAELHQLQTPPATAPDAPLTDESSLLQVCIKLPARDSWPTSLMADADLGYGKELEYVRVTSADGAKCAADLAEFFSFRAETVAAGSTDGTRAPDPTSARSLFFRSDKLIWSLAESIRFQAGIAGSADTAARARLAQLRMRTDHRTRLCVVARLVLFALGSADELTAMRAKASEIEGVMVAVGNFSFAQMLTQPASLNPDGWTSHGDASILLAQSSLQRYVAAAISTYAGQRYSGRVL